MDGFSNTSSAAECQPTIAPSKPYDLAQNQLLPQAGLCSKTPLKSLNAWCTLNAAVFKDKQCQGTDRTQSRSRKSKPVGSSQVTKSSLDQLDRVKCVIEGARSVLNIPPSDSTIASANIPPSEQLPERINALLQQARLATEAYRSKHADDPSSDTVCSPEPRNPFLERAKSVVHDTIRAHSEWSAKRLNETEDALRPFEGLPVHFDILSLMGVDGNEAVFCRLLAWLLDPEGSHGVGDSFLRLFLARLGVASNGKVFNYSHASHAEVITEVSWRVPLDEEFVRIEENDSHGRSSDSMRLRVDILIVVQGYVIPVEVKIYAIESLYRFHGAKWAQAALYGRMWELMMAANRARRDQLEKKSRTSSHEGWRAAFRSCVVANPKLRHREYFFDSGRASVIPVLIHPRGRCRTSKYPIGQRPNEQGMQVRHLRWLDIDRMLYRICRDRDLQDGRLDLIRSFRTTILRLATDTDLLSRIEDLRLRMSEPALTRRFPITSSTHLDAAIKDLNHVEVCCDETNVGTAM